MTHHAPTSLLVEGLPHDMKERNLRFYRQLNQVRQEYSHVQLRKIIASRFPKAHKAISTHCGEGYFEIDVVQFLFPTPKCRVCGNQYQVKPNLMPWCSNRCMGNDPKIQSQKKRTSLLRFGVDNPFKSEEVMGKVRDDRMLRTGYRHARQNPIINRRAKRKQLKTVRDRYGVSNVMHLPSTLVTRVATYQERFGEDHPMKTQEVFYRAMVEAHRIKQYEYHGRKYKVQSTYESRIFRQLVDKFGIEDVHTQFHPEFPNYIMQEAGTWPDLYIASRDIFVEVKSTWTLWGNDHLFNANRRKAKASNESGNVVRWVLLVPGKGKVILPKAWYRMTREDLKAYSMANLR